MSSILTEGWFPVLTLLIGFGTHSVSEWLRDRRTSKRDREARAAARRDQRLEHRTTFQRQTLLELQETALDMSRFTGRIWHLDRMASRQSGKWQQQLVPDDLDEGYRAAQARTFMLGSRARDVSIRDSVDKFKACSAEVVYSSTREDAERAMRSLELEIDELNRRIGERLRELDDTEAAEPR